MPKLVYWLDPCGRMSETTWHSFSFFGGTRITMLRFMWHGTHTGTMPAAPPRLTALLLFPVVWFLSCFRISWKVLLALVCLHISVCDYTKGKEVICHPEMCTDRSFLDSFLPCSNKHLVAFELPLALHNCF